MALTALLDTDMNKLSATELRYTSSVLLKTNWGINRQTGRAGIMSNRSERWAPMQENSVVLWKKPAS